MILYGWYSEEQKRKVGHVIYQSALGEEVVLTEASPNVEYVPYYDDVVYVGVVTRFVKSYVRRVGILA